MILGREDTSSRFNSLKIINQSPPLPHLLTSTERERRRQGPAVSQWLGGEVGLEEILDL
jgi:hypothetical protein